MDDLDKVLNDAKSMKNWMERGGKREEGRKSMGGKVRDGKAKGHRREEDEQDR